MRRSEDITGETFCFGVEGPKALGTAQAASLPVPNHRFAHIDAGGCVSAISSTGAPAARIHGPIARRDEALQSLEAAGAIAASPEDAKIVRLRHFQPRYGVDITKPRRRQSRRMRCIFRRAVIWARRSSNGFVRAGT